MRPKSLTTRGADTMNPYPAEEKAKMDAIMAAFKPYIDAHYYFDILYSAKCGYVYIVVNEDEVPAVILENASDLLDRLINEIRGDVRAENGDHMEIEDSPEEIMEIRRRTLSYLDSMDPELRSFCIDVMTMCMVGEALISD